MASSSFTPRPLAAASASASAVPDGASTLCLWCASKISISKSLGPRRAASCSTTDSSTLTPTLIFAACSTAARAAAAVIAASSTAPRPVVPITSALPLAWAAAVLSMVAEGVVKSISTSQAAKTASRSEIMRTPQSPKPHSAPMSRPRAVLSPCSPAAASVAAPCAPDRISLAIIWPMRPAAPRMPILVLPILVMCGCFRFLSWFAGVDIYWCVHCTDSGPQLKFLSTVTLSACSVPSYSKVWLISILSMTVSCMPSGAVSVSFALMRPFFSSAS